jgi:hypothetical protein
MKATEIHVELLNMLEERVANEPPWMPKATALAAF